MKNSITTLLLYALIGIATMSPALSFASYETARDPEEPMEGDPDLSAIDDARLLRLWEDTVVAYRRENPYGGSIYGYWVGLAKTLSPSTPEDQVYLMDAFETAITKTPVDWNYVRTILIVMQAAMEATPRIPELANRMYKMPRPIKMSFAHGHSYMMMIPVLQMQKSEEAAALLCEMAHAPYWGDDPMFSPMLSKTNKEESIYRLRRLSVGALSNFPPAIALPYLEKLAVAYPVPEDFEEKVRTRTLDRAWSDHEQFVKRIQQAICELQAKAATQGPDSANSNTPKN